MVSKRSLFRTAKGTKKNVVIALVLQACRELPFSKIEFRY
jgi:hypothetical protein